jgi:hypothetical protein
VKEYLEKLAALLDNYDKLTHQQRIEQFDECHRVALGVIERATWFYQI